MRLVGPAPRPSGLPALPLASRNASSRACLRVCRETAFPFFCFFCSGSGEDPLGAKVKKVAKSHDGGAGGAEEKGGGCCVIA